MRINLVKTQVPPGPKYQYHGLFSGTTHTYCDMVATIEAPLMSYKHDFLNRVASKIQFSLFSFDSALMVRL